MKVSIKRTDKRMNGHEFWQYVAQSERKDFSGFKGVAERMLTLNTVREWCWTTYGPSCELTHWMALNTNGFLVPSEQWCWHTEYDNFKIYLRTDKEANWFKLKWL
jgi:hypothetical protein